MNFNFHPMNKKLLLIFLIVIISCQTHGANGGDSTKVHYYENGRVKDSLHLLEPGYEKQINYYETGEVKQAGIVYNGFKQGAWPMFDKQGHVINTQYYDSSRLVNKNIDPNDFEFAEYKVDPSFSLMLPSHWQTSPAEDTLDSGIKRWKSFQPDSDYSARIIIHKLLAGVIQGHNPTEITNFVRRAIDENYKNEYHKIVWVRWPKTNVMMITYMMKSDGKLIGVSDIYYFGTENCYYINCSAYSGPHWEFIKYTDVFLESMYSMKWKGNGVF